MARQFALPYPLPLNEKTRLAAVEEYQFSDSEVADEFDNLMRLASRLFHVPIVLISLMGSTRQYFKACGGIELKEIDREVSFCAHTVAQGEVIVVPDAIKDARFATNPFVTGHPYVRFYVGYPLKAPDGHTIGTLCLIDHKPRAPFTRQDHKNLADVAGLIMERMENIRIEKLQMAEQLKFHHMATTSPDAVISLDEAGRIAFWNRSAETLFGHPLEEVLGQPGLTVLFGTARKETGDLLKKLKDEAGSSGERCAICARVEDKKGRVFPCEFSFTCFPEGAQFSIHIVARDISEREKDKKRLTEMSYKDPLTGLPNRGACMQALSEAVARSQAFSVLIIDLDDFKEINETHGHLIGDTVIEQTAQRLARNCEAALTVGRLDGDEFLILLPGMNARRNEAVAARLLSALHAPYKHKECSLDLTASIGAALSGDGDCPETIFSAAELALNRAKSNGKARFQAFEPLIREVAIARRNFQHELRGAFERGQLELFYQAQFLSDGQTLVGAEALMRWNHPTRGLLSPISFMDALEQKPSAAEIGNWALRVACEQAAIWRQMVPSFRIGFNLFDAQLGSNHFPQQVLDILQQSKLPPQALELEIVENIVLQNDSVTLKRLQALRKLGLSLAFDDYGTGFASLSVLKRYPVSRLKIDRMFVQDVESDPEHAAIIEAILFLARSFGMEVIAEGVETPVQLEFLRERGCPQAQGYLLGRPMPSGEFEQQHLFSSSALAAVN